MNRMWHWPDGLSQDSQRRYRCASKTPLDRATFDRFVRAVNTNPNKGGGHGSDDSPRLLAHFVADGLLDLSRPDMAGVVFDVWTNVNVPRDYLEEDDWQTLFEANGYSHVGLAAERPTEAVLLYRGCTYPGRFGMAWTPDLEVARRFAYDEIRGRLIGQVYTATVEPEYLLAFNATERAQLVPGIELDAESEYLVDSRGLSDENVTLFEVSRP